MDLNHRIDWDNVKILKSETRAFRRRFAKSFLINQMARSLSIINRNHDTNFPAVYSMYNANI